MTQTAQTKRLDTLQAIAALLDGYQPVAYTPAGSTAPGIPAVRAWADEWTLTVACGERSETLSLVGMFDDEGQRFGRLMLTGRGGYILPTIADEHFWLLAAVLPMEEDPTWTGFRLNDMARQLGYRLVSTTLELRSPNLLGRFTRMLRLEHPEYGVVWGCDFTPCDYDHVLVLGGVPVASSCMEPYVWGWNDPDGPYYESGTALRPDVLEYVLHATEFAQFETLESMPCQVQLDTRIQWELDNPQRPVSRLPQLPAPPTPSHPDSRPPRLRSDLPNSGLIFPTPV